MQTLCVVHFKMQLWSYYYQCNYWCTACDNITTTNRHIQELEARQARLNGRTSSVFSMHAYMQMRPDYTDWLCAPCTGSDSFHHCYGTSFSFAMPTSISADHKHNRKTCIQTLGIPVHHVRSLLPRDLRGVINLPLTPESQDGQPYICWCTQNKGGISKATARKHNCRVNDRFEGTAGSVRHVCLTDG